MTKITQLPVASTITNDGVFVIFDEGITKQLTWQTLRSGGLKGDTGTTGAVGPIGPRGATGTVATIQIGTISVASETNTATITATTSTTSAFITILDFVVPKGEKGDTGTFIPVVASTSSIGAVRIGDGINVDPNGLISVTSYSLPIATSQFLGGVKIGQGINISGDGTISATTATQYVLPVSSGTVLGGVKVGAGINVDAEGVISVTTGAFALQTATNVVLGGVRIGSGLSITASGTVSVSLATTSSVGGVRIGNGLDINPSTGVVSVNSSTTNAELLSGAFLANNVTASNITILGTLTNLSVAGTTVLGQTQEVFFQLTSATGVVVHNCTSGTVFVHNQPLDNWTANFTNFTIPSNRLGSAAVLVYQGSTPRLPVAVQMNGSPQTVAWQGGIVPTGNANKIDLINFTFISPVGTLTNFTILASLSSYG